VVFGLIVLLVLLAQSYLPPLPLKIGAATVLFAFGAYRLIRARHPNWVGMRVGFRDLAVWSFIMASAHGAGLMLVPVFLGSSKTGSHAHETTAHAGHGQPIESILPEAGAPFFGPLLGLAAVAVNDLAQLVAEGADVLPQGGVVGYGCHGYGIRVRFVQSFSPSFSKQSFPKTAQPFPVHPLV
jgi:hypothetical protein